MTSDSPYIGRFVAFLSPLWLAVAVFIANTAQDWLQIDLDETQLAGFISVFVLSIAGLLYKWLDNRVKFELADSIQTKQINTTTVVTDGDAEDAVKAINQVPDVEAPEKDLSKF